MYWYYIFELLTELLSKPSTNATNYKLWMLLAIITSISFTEYWDGKHSWVKSATATVWNVVLLAGHESPEGLCFSGSGDKEWVFNSTEVDTAWGGYVMYHSSK